MNRIDTVITKGLAALLSATVLWSAQAMSVSIPNAPLFASTSVEPNIMILMDDSSSMTLGIMPDEVYAKVWVDRPASLDGFSLVDTSSDNDVSCFVRSAANNTVYYNPEVRYLPWATWDGGQWPDSDPTAASDDPVSPFASLQDLTSDQTLFAWWRGDGFGVKTVYPATYYQYTGDPNDTSDDTRWNCDNYIRIQIRPENAPFPKYPERTDCAGAVCTYEEEIQNFANWYTYYSTRALAARAGIGRALSTLSDNVRVGFAYLNGGNGVVDGINNGSVIRGVRTFGGSDREAVFDELYTHGVGGSTPLRQALDAVGQYFSRTDSKGPWSSTPGQEGGVDYSCRKSFVVAITDGYWNLWGADTPGARANNDGTNGPSHTSPSGDEFTYAAVSPFTDGRSDTLADVAMYYWKRDLRPDLENRVPTDTQDPAFWQHLVTFGVGLGVFGTIDPDEAFARILQEDPAPLNWPDPIPTIFLGSNEAKIDDLLHAAVNSRGGFYSAANPKEFADGISIALQSILSRISSGASVTVNSTTLTTSSLVFQSVFNPAKWSGDLQAFSISSSGVADTPAWRASGQLPDPELRKIYTTSGGDVVEFLFSNLSAADQAYLGGVDEVNYLRGDRSNEAQNGGILRERAADSVIGDIVHSSPYYVKEDEVVYVGSNDGMLHAVSASTGVELFAYVPSAVVPRLRNLTLPTYGTPTNPHQFLVDGEIAVSDESQTPGKNYLVATLGRGGRGLFALDVSDPQAFSETSVLWEYFDDGDADLGFMLGQPVIARMNDGSVRAIVGNGYNSTSGKAVLYLVDIVTGGVVKLDTGVAEDNGMGSPGLFDEDGNGTVDWIYAGDLKGNVWKMDVRGASASAWGFAFGTAAEPEPLFTARDPSGVPQPITAPMTIAVDDVLSDPNYGKRFVFFGTGSYFRSNDPADTQVQTWYGLIDQGVQIDSRTSGSYATLTRRQIYEEGTVSGSSVRSFEEATFGDMSGKSGWYLDFDTQTGERMVTEPQLYTLAERVLVASSIIPVVDPCEPDGRGYINAISPFTGARLSLGFFDLNDNADFNDDVLNDTLIGGVDPGVGMPSRPVLVGDRLLAGGSRGEVASVRVNPGLPANKGRFFWREIILE